MASAGHQQMLVEVREESTLLAAQSLSVECDEARIGVLNFASARHPGGGFLKGADAQEESLARSSGLYLSLLECRTYYDGQRGSRDGLNTDDMIWSPECPVVRDHDGTLLDRPYLVDFITSTAPNVSSRAAKRQPAPSEVLEALKLRIGKILALAAHHECTHLVLGAWGCGVYANDPTEVAAAFYGHLRPKKGMFWGRFEKVIFAIAPDGPKRNLDCFRRRFC